MKPTIKRPIGRQHLLINDLVDELNLVAECANVTGVFKAHGSNAVLYRNEAFEVSIPIAMGLVKNLPDKTNLRQIKTVLTKAHPKEIYKQYIFGE